MDNLGVAGKFKMAAGIIHNDRLICVGLNQYKTHPIMAKFGYRDGQVYLHAEADAIVKATRQLSAWQLMNSTLFVARVKRSGKNGRYIPALAKPCKGCQAMIASFGIQNVEWTEEQS
jgi:deoxycytidylate deaminase